MTTYLKSMLTLTAVSVALAFALNLAPAPSGAADVTAANVSDHIASAKTAADHEAIAGYFRSEAAAEGERVKTHEAMLESYKKSSGKPYLVMIDHCKAAIAKSRDLEKEYSKMAELHGQMAKAAGKSN
jgi:hypothetical protein